MAGAQLKDVNLEMAQEKLIDAIETVLDRKIRREEEE